jgi:hypothetical protein
MPDAKESDIFDGEQVSDAISVPDVEAFEKYVRRFEAFEGTTYDENGTPSSDRILAFASGDIYTAANNSVLARNSLVGIRNSIESDDNYTKMVTARKYSEQVTLVQQLANLRASLWGLGFAITHSHKAVEQAYRNLADRFGLTLDVPLLMRDLSMVNNSALVWAEAEGSADLAFFKFYRPESTRIEILTNTLWLKPSEALEKEIKSARGDKKKKYLESLKPGARKKAEKLWESIKNPKHNTTHPGYMPITEDDQEYWQTFKASGGSSKQSYETVGMQSIFTDIELLKMLIEGDWATAFLLKNMIMVVKVGESIDGGQLQGSRRNWAKSKDIANLKEQIEKTGKAQILYGNHTIAIEFAHPDEKVFSPEKYDAVINRICTFFGIGHYMILGASSGSSRGASYAAASWNVQTIRTKTREIREIVDKQLQSVYAHKAVVSAAFMNTGDIPWHDCFASINGNMLKFVDTEFKMLAKENIGEVQYSKNGFATHKTMAVKDVLVDNSSLVLNTKIPTGATPDQFRLFLTGSQIINLLGPPKNRFDSRGLKEDRQVLAEVIAARGDGIISALQYAQELGWNFDEQTAQKMKELDIPELLVPIFEKNQGMVEKILAEVLGIAIEEIENGGDDGKSGRPQSRREGDQDTNEHPRPSTASVDPDDADLVDLRIAVWKSLKDVPSRLKSLHGVKLTLTQINDIAKHAEGAEAGGADNGWAVARAHFQKTHHIKNGRWVKKKD